MSSVIGVKEVSNEEECVSSYNPRQEEADCSYIDLCIS